MSKYINQFQVVKDYISNNYIKNEEFISSSKETLINDIRFNTGSKVKTILEVLELYIKKGVLKEKDDHIFIFS